MSGFAVLKRCKVIAIDLGTQGALALTVKKLAYFICTVKVNPYHLPTPNPPTPHPHPQPQPQPPTPTPLDKMAAILQTLF